jgi:hypothetical protein
VAVYLERGTLVNQYRGLSSCRFCDRYNGSAELSDGTYCWPEGLAHYLWDHEVRLPSEFVAHVTTSPGLALGAVRPGFDQRGMRDRSWPEKAFRDQMSGWDLPQEHGLDVEVDPSWWLSQAGRKE